MDSITHIALGAVTGEAIAGKYLGRRAMLYGALAQSLPDIDFIGSLFLDPTVNLLFHRGFTHSLLFGLLSVLLMAYAAHMQHQSLRIPKATLLALFASEIGLHLLLDTCNAYGVGLLEPFSSKRFSVHALFVVDPFFSAPVCVAMLLLIFMDSKNRMRRICIASGLLLTTGVFLYAIANKLMIVRETTALLERQNIRYNRLLTTPTPMNTWLWYVAAETDSGYFMTYRSTADPKEQALDLTFVRRRQELLRSFKDDDEVKRLIRFSQGYYVVTKDSSDIIFNDLRFGQIAGWVEPNPKYVFHYYLNDKNANAMVIQRGRFTKWNRRTFEGLIARIKGNR